MDSTTLDFRAQGLVDRLTSSLDDCYGTGFMSAAVYDTAWVSMISKPAGNTKVWLFPQCFQYLLAQQRSDGSWASYASQIDGILNTAASLLSLSKHRNNLFQLHDLSVDDLSDRITRATTALQQLLDNWQVAATIHVGFEILVPALLDYLRDEGISLDFPGKAAMMQINQQKLQKFKPEYLYGKAQLTALHSLEAFIGKIDFDRVAHHKVNGSFMASPSSTAAYMLNASSWDDDCEDYLRHVVVYAAGQRSGGVPSAFPSTIFELTWSVSTLLEGGFDLASVAPYHTSKVTKFLSKCFDKGNGTVGFGADADDSSKTILILNLLNCPTSAKSLLHEFEADQYFKTYPLERDPSFSANCNVMIALLHVQNISEYTPQIEKVARFLLAKWRDEGFGIRDKWNISPYYSMMLLTQAMTRLLAVWDQGSLPSLPECLKSQVIGLLVDISRFTIQSCNVNGSWGLQKSREETAYAILALACSLGGHTSQAFKADATTVINKGRNFLISTGPSKADHLWVEKVTYASDILLESYVLAALKIGLPSVQQLSNTDVNDVVISNGVVHHSLASQLPSVEVAYRNGYTNGIAHSPNGHVEKASKSNGHVESAITNTSSHAKKINDIDMNGSNYTGQVAASLASNSNPQDMLDTSRRTNIPCWNAEKENIILGPFRYLEKQPGKDMRSQFISSFNNWLHVPPGKLAIIERVIKMLHTASLLVDDIEDNSDLRRGHPVAHSIFGIPQTFNSGNYVYFLALQEIRKLQSQQAVDIYIEELINLHRGQGLDLFWRDSLTCPSEEEYLEMVANKTGGLFSLAIRLMQAESPTDRDLVPLVALLGLQFQICDDYLNLMSTTYTKNKGLCEDLTEGKFSFPIIHSIRSDPSNRELINILKQKTRDAEVKKYAVQYMQGTGSFGYTRNTVKDLNDKALKLISGYEAQGWGEGLGIRKLLSRMDLS